MSRQHASTRLNLQNVISATTLETKLDTIVISLSELSREGPQSVEYFLKLYRLNRYLFYAGLIKLATKAAAGNAW
jgi:hypothetical protein